MPQPFKLYPTYKPSGVPWLGDIPAHWEVQRLKQAATLNPSRTEARMALESDTPVAFIPMERVGTDGKIDEEILHVSAGWNGFTYFRRNDVIVAKITPCFENGKGACLDSLSTEIGFGSTEFHVLRAKSLLAPQFLYHVTTLTEFRRLGADAMTGAAGQQRVPQEFVSNYPIAIPPLPEQTAIVRYLDHADERIRRYISGKQKLIRLLEEEKQAVIHRAVTRGLDPNVRLKDSGVEWLGDVPAHWEVCRTKHLFRLRTEKSGIAHGRELLSIYTHIGVRPRKDLEEKGNKASTTDDYWIVKKGDIIANKLLAWMGAIGVSRYEGVTSPAYDILMPVIDLSSDYYHHLFRTKLYLQQFKQRSRGIMDMRLRLYFDQFGQIPIPVPPADEQQEIVDYYKDVTSKTDDCINQARRQIELLREYHTRLIADVVTGQLDVREAVARLPDEEPEPLDDRDALSDATDDLDVVPAEAEA